MEDYFNKDNLRIWLVIFKESFELGVMISSQSRMSPHWNEILKEEDTSVVRLMNNSLKCSTTLIQQLRSKYLDLGGHWDTFCEVCPVLITQYLKYLSEFKDVYLNPLLRDKATVLGFKSPWISSLILRYQFIVSIVLWVIHIIINCMYMFTFIKQYNYWWFSYVVPNMYQK